MQLTPYVESLIEDLTAAADVGGEAVSEAARRLAGALESSLRLRMLEVLSEAAVEVASQLPSGRVDVRLAGRDPQLVFVDDVPPEPEPPAAASADDGLSARITLRLPESLKTSVEAAAARDGVSTNTWLVRALARSLEPQSSKRSVGRRMTGYGWS
jgi:hypothetical protein